MQALHTLLMMTAEFMLSKRPVLRFDVALLLLLNFYFRSIFLAFRNLKIYSQIH